MLQVVHFFQPIIHSNVLRPCIDEQGNYTFYVDPFVKGHIENGLLRAILGLPEALEQITAFFIGFPMGIYKMLMGKPMKGGCQYEP